MARPNLKLKLPETADVIETLHAKEVDPHIKNRLLALKLASTGTLSAAEVAQACGMARGYLFTLIKIARTKGVHALLQREKPGPKVGSFRGLTPAMVAEFKAKRISREFTNARHAQLWLVEAHGIAKPYRTVWRWLHNFDAA